MLCRWRTRRPGDGERFYGGRFLAALENLTKAQPLPAIADRDPTVFPFTDGDATAGRSPVLTLSLQLQPAPVVTDHPILAHHPFLLQTKHLIQLSQRRTAQMIVSTCRLPFKTAVVLFPITLPQILVGRLVAADPAQPQLLY